MKYTPNNYSVFTMSTMNTLITLDQIKAARIFGHASMGQAKADANAKEMQI